MTLTLPDGEGKLQLISSLAEINRTLSLLYRVEFGVAGATLGLAGLLLVLLVGAALSPLRRMRIVADRIRRGARGERLRPTRPGTDLGRTASALDEMLEALETAETQARMAQQGMQRLLADVSHDLRTPIAGVLSSAEQLLLHDPGRRAREKGLVDLIREGRRAARLVNDLLLVTRLDVGESIGDGTYCRTEAQSVLTAAVDDAKRRRPDHHIELVAQPATVGLEPDRFTRVVANLLDNACTAAGTNGTVRATLRKDGDTVIVEISDDGPGVPAEYSERIFDRLFRLDLSRHVGGSGLGLPIARGLARTVGGDVCHVGPASADGSGAVFRLGLPSLTGLPALSVLDASSRTAEPSGSPRREGCRGKVISAAPLRSVIR